MVVGEDRGGLLSGSGERELSLETQKAPSISQRRRCRPETTHRVKRVVNISRRALRVVVVEGESRDDEGAHARAGLYLCADTLSHSLQTTTERPEFSLWVFRSLARSRARPPGVPSPPPPNPPVVRARDHRAYGPGSPEPPTAFPSPRVFDLSLPFSPTAREKRTRENSCERDLFSTEKRDRQRVVVFTAATRRRRHSLTATTTNDTAEPRVLLLRLVGVGDER